MVRHINDYADCDVFKPDERWQSPRGTFYYVLESQVNGAATLRTLSAAWASHVRIGTDRLGRLRKVSFDGVIGWVRIASAAHVLPGEALPDT